MPQFQTRILEETEAPPLDLLLARLPPHCRPLLLDASDGSGSSVLVWSPDQVCEGSLRPGSGGRHGWPLADRDPVAEVEAAFAHETWHQEEDFPFPSCGWFGWFGFECGHAWEAWPWAEGDRNPLPDWSFARYRRAAVRDAQGWTRFCWAEGEGDSPSMAQETLSSWHDLLQAPNPPVSQDPPLVLQPRSKPDDFQAQVTQLRHAIAQGELFQANLSHALHSPAPSCPRSLYRSVRAQQPTRFSAYWEDDQGRSLLSWSPECFLRVNSQEICTRPIKGTAPRGRDPREDQQWAAALESSDKERAELTMIVDMARNDLGRVARPGTVRTPSVGEVEAWPTLQHRIATVRAQRDPAFGFADLLRATFPPASVTGAPKVRALQAIVELEGEPRGPYCGTLGHWLPGAERGVFSVLIRTATVAHDSLRMHVGAGIVWDSDPKREWEETLLKARYLDPEVVGVPVLAPS